MLFGGWIGDERLLLFQRINSYLPHGISPPSVTSVPGEPIPSHIHAHKLFFLIKCQKNVCNCRVEGDDDVRENAPSGFY